MLSNLAFAWDHMVDMQSSWQVDDDFLAILQALDYENSLKVWWWRTYAKRGKTLSDRYADNGFYLQSSLLANDIKLNTITATYDTTNMHSALK